MLNLAGQDLKIPIYASVIEVDIYASRSDFCKCKASFRGFDGVFLQAL